MTGQQQGVGPADVAPLPAEDGLGGPGFSREESAITWATGLAGSSAYAWYCEKFVENAFNVTGQFGTAWKAATTLGLRGGAAPRGALVFFRPHSSNANYGHVGISLGDGRMISAKQTVGVDAYTTGYWGSLYAGWAPAPANWSGRNIVPAAPAPNTTPAPSAPAGPPAVQLSSPSSGANVSGVVQITANATNVSAVAFSAYYATDPNNISTVGWHTIATDSDPAGGWSASWDTRNLPDQGNSGWGTVNIAATALNSAGAAIDARDYRRVNLTNGNTVPGGSTPAGSPSQPSNPGPSTPASYNYQVTGTCRDGACGLKIRTGPGYSNFSVVRVVPDGTTLAVVCQAAGETVSNGYSSSAIWDRLTDGTWASDFYLSTPNIGTWSPPIPRC